jgi:hypothetical protein
MAKPLAILWGSAARAGRLDLASLSGDIAADQALLIEPGRTPALRLNSDTGRRYPPERLTELAGADAKLAALQEEAARGLDLFARHPRRFLALYFQFIGARLEAERQALEERLAWSGGLFTHRDWAFSALRPLPRAALAEFADDRLRPVTSVVEFAFWTGEEALLVTIGAAASGQVGPDAAASWPVRRIALTPPELASPEDLFSRERFGGAFGTFWEGAGWPAGPYRPRGLEGLRK